MKTKIYIVFCIILVIDLLLDFYNTKSFSNLSYIYDVIHALIITVVVYLFAYKRQKKSNNHE